eukprot:g3176.t1
MRITVTAWIFMVCFIFVCNASSCPNDCSGHGTCDTASHKCTCEDGFGSETDISIYKSGDCSERICPAGRAFFDVASGDTSAHEFAECSAAGICDRNTGKCQCFQAYTGKACDRLRCPNDCSGHGTCMSMKRLAKTNDAMPLSHPAEYEGNILTETWDEDSMYGCKCDSSWPVGLGSGERQAAEFYGPDCSSRRGPTGDDPFTERDETICGNAARNGATDFGSVGARGNLCHVECSNRGIADPATGECTCFSGWEGTNCGVQNVMAGATS